MSPATPSPGVTIGRGVSAMVSEAQIQPEPERNGYADASGLEGVKAGRNGKAVTVDGDQPSMATAK
jgi:hypothetical protein